METARVPGLVRRVVAVLRAALPPRVRVDGREGRRGEIVLTLPGRRLRARWAGSGLVGEVRAALDAAAQPPHLVVARRMSPGARELLSRRGIGWADELGAAELAIGTILVARTGRRPEPARKPTGWTPAVLAVSEALLAGTRATVPAMQRALGLSSGSCTNALRLLTERRLLAADAPRGRASARRVADLDALLEAYAAAAAAAAAQRPPLSLVVGVTWRDPVAGLEALGRAWTQDGLEWAATGAVAAAVVAPLLTSVSSSTVYVDARTAADLEAIARRSDLRPIEGGRLTLAPFPTVATRRLAEPRAGMRLAPWPRIYADLRTIGVRGDEASQHLLEVVRGR